MHKFNYQVSIYLGKGKMVDVTPIPCPLGPDGSLYLGGASDSLKINAQATGIPNFKGFLYFVCQGFIICKFTLLKMLNF